MTNKAKGIAVKKDKKSDLKPKLRFPEFRDSDNWSKSPLANLGSFSSGGTPAKDNPAYWDGDIPWISASSMHELKVMDSEQKVTSEAIGNGTRLARKGTLLILVRGSMLFNRVPICIATRDVAFNQDVKALTLHAGIDTDFLLTFLQATQSRIPINETGIGAGKIDSGILKQLPILIPTTAEQSKIAACLSSLDELIGAHRRKLDALKAYKKGLMQQLFPREGETLPRLRFPEFQNAPEWSAVVLGQVIEVASGQVNPTELPYCDYPQIGGENIESRSGNLKNVKTAREKGVISGNYLFDEKDILYSKIRPALNKVASPKFRGICSADIYPIRPASGELIGLYLLYLLRSVQFVKYATSSSARSKIPKINRDALFGYTALLPSPVEQNQIAACLSSLDDLILSKVQKLDALKIHKNGLMQQLFPSSEDNCA